MIDFDLAKNINTQINEVTCYQSDLERVGRIEFWDVALGKGDCEDYALAKRRALLDSGSSINDIHMATCIVEGMGGHAVLIVNTDKGDYVLDNRYPEPMEKHFLPYTDWSMQVGDKWYAVL